MTYEFQKNKNMIEKAYKCNVYTKAFLKDNSNKWNEKKKIQMIYFYFFSYSLNFMDFKKKLMLVYYKYRNFMIFYVKKQNYISQKKF